MKHIYIKPSQKVWKIDAQSGIMTASDPETEKLPVYNDDPQKPGNALVRRRNSLWDDEEE